MIEPATKKDLIVLNESQEAPGWSAQKTNARPMADNTLTRFFGGAPLAVLLKLLFVSLIVGALLVWLDIRPADIIYGVERFFRRLWDMGFDAIRDVAQYIVAGAIIVVPIWLIMRLMAVRGR
ncbi:MAG: uncharacterized protein JWN07_878 [Hyphomicrobiales bacterium]|nr:uncharacterized protein [Hyphomicrobiales bacterium]